MVGLDTAQLPTGLHTMTLTPSADDLAFDPETFDPDAFEDIEIDVRLDHEPDRDLVAFTARATATLQCDRTLQPFQQDIQGSYAVLFVLPEQLDHYQTDGGEEDIRPLPEAGNDLDITNAVRDTLVLALPARRIAPGAEDEDLQVQFGALKDADGDPMDPRWEALKKLRDSG